MRYLEDLEFQKVGCWPQHRVLQLDGSREMAQDTYYLAEDTIVPSTISCGLQWPVTSSPENLASFSDF